MRMGAAAASLWSGPRLRFAAAALVVINGFFPAVWILLTSLKAEAELVSRPISYLPRAPTLANYVSAFTDQPLPGSDRSPGQPSTPSAKAAAFT